MYKQIWFGNNVMVSWQCLIMDTDFHKIIKNQKTTNDDQEIRISDSVWIGCRSTILKGTKIGNLIASNSNVVKAIEDDHVIIGGNPAKVICRDIEWYY